MVLRAMWPLWRISVHAEAKTYLGLQVLKKGEDGVGQLLPRQPLHDRPQHLCALRVACAARACVLPLRAVYLTETCSTTKHDSL